MKMKILKRISKKEATEKYGVITSDETVYINTF